MAFHNVNDPTYGGNIQAAIDKCRPDGGGTVYVPSGRYTLPDTLRITDPVTLLGDGPFSSIIWAPASQEGITVAGAAPQQLRAIPCHNFRWLVRARGTPPG